MATQNVINKFSQDLTIDPGAAGDSYTQFSINGTGEFRIGVDDTDDSFRISQGNALGTNDTFVMSAAGERTMPLQPSFGAYLSSTASDATGDNTDVQIAFDSEVWDQNSDYNAGLGRFTAPVDGCYLLSFTCRLLQVGAAHTAYFYKIVAIGVANFGVPGTNGNTKVGTLQDNASWLIQMDAADIALVTIRVAYGTKIVDIYGGATDFITAFSGALVA